MRSALSTGRQPAKPERGFNSLANTAPNAPVTGLVRIYWRLMPGFVAVPGSVPRVKIAWSVQVRGVGELQNFNLYADARYGSIEITATSCGIEAGYLDTDTLSPDSVAMVEATIFDVGSGSGRQYATLTMPLVVEGAVGPAPGTASVAIPPQAVSMRWFDKAASDVSITCSDLAGTEVQLARTGIPAAGAPIVPPLFVLEPESGGGTAVVANNTVTKIENGRLVFYYYGDQ